MRRDRYGEPVELEDDDPLELHAWDGRVAHARRVAREALPPRDPDGALWERRTDSLRKRLDAQRAGRASGYRGP